MPGIEILKDWQALKKQGLTGLVVAIIWGITAIIGALEPKDKSCTEAVKYLQSENTEYRKALLATNRELSELRESNKQKDTLIRVTDSIYREKVIKPSKKIIKEYNHDK